MSSSVWNFSTITPKNTFLFFVNTAFFSSIVINNHFTHHAPTGEPAYMSTRLLCYKPFIKCLCCNDNEVFVPMFT